MPQTRAPDVGRPLNVSLLAGSGAHRAYYDRSGSGVSDEPITSRMLPSVMLPGAIPATIYKDQVEALVARICRHRAPTAPTLAAR